jgi:hypothetical protein
MARRSRGSARGQGGVGIVMSSEAVQDWEEGGSVVYSIEAVCVHVE